MKVFISWSGEKSRDIANALRDWIPDVLQAAEPFVSSRDVAAGSRWALEIAERLEDADFGLVCVTRENQHMPWLNFEAGAIAKSLDASRVVPIAIDLTPALSNAHQEIEARSYADTGDAPSSRSEGDMLEEILSSVRDLSRASERATTLSWATMERELAQTLQALGIKNWSFRQEPPGTIRLALQQNPSMDLLNRIQDLERRSGMTFIVRVSDSDDGPRE